MARYTPNPISLIHKSKDKTLTILPNGYHEPMQDIERADCYSKILNWIETRYEKSENFTGGLPREKCVFGVPGYKRQMVVRFLKMLVKIAGVFWVLRWLKRK